MAYKRGGVWWARFTVNGVKYRQSLETNDRRKALDDEKDLIAKAKAGMLAAPSAPFSGLKVSEAVDQFLSERKPAIAAKTAQTEAERAKPVKAKLGALALKKLSADVLRAYIRDRHEAGAANATVNRELDIVRGVMKRAKLWTAVADEVKPLPVRHDVGQALEHEELVRLTKTAAARPEWQAARLAMTLALNTTMRSKEIRMLRWRDIDMLNRTISVRRVTTKTDAGERVIPLNEEAWAAVLELRQRSKLAFGTEAGPHWFVFFSNAENAEQDPLKPVGSFKRAWLSIRRSISCPECGTLQKPGARCWKRDCHADISKLQSSTANFRFHDTRHQAITMLAESSSATDATIMGIAGHVSKKMLEHYSHARMAAKRAALDSLVSRGGQGTVRAQFLSLGGQEKNESDLEAL